MIQPPRTLRPWLPFLLAHHPACVFFEADTYRVGRVRLCVGCFTAYPIALAAFAMLWTWGVQVSPWLWLALGLLLGSAQFVAVVGRARSRAAKVAVKAALGLGLAATVYALLVLPVPFGWRLAALLAGLAAAGLALVPRGIRMLATCRACVWGGDWQRCPGFVKVRRPWPA